MCVQLIACSHVVFACLITLCFYVGMLCVIIIDASMFQYLHVYVAGCMIALVDFNTTVILIGFYFT